MSKEAERQEQERRRRENDRQADASGDAIASALLSFFKSILPQWLYDFIFEEDPNAPGESADDMAPSTAGEKVSTARAVYNSGAVKKWEASKNEYTGGSVVHSSPVASASRSSGYGMRMHPIHKVMKMHNGDDITGGGDIQASADGTVLFAGRKGGYGNTVIIGHDDGTKTLYAHMTGAKMPTIGERVLRGEAIGVMGSTGQSTGVHLHYEQFDKNGRHRKPVIDGVAELKEHHHDHEVIAATPKGAAKPKPLLAAADHKLPSSVRLAATKAVAPKKNDDEPAKEKSLLADGFQFKDIKEGASTVFANATSAIGNVLGNLTGRS